MRTRRVLPAPLLILALVLALAPLAAADTPAPVALYPEQAARGETLSGAVVSREGFAWLQAVLQDGSGKAVSAGRGFALGEDGRLWCFLVALPSTLTGGDYTLHLEAGGPDETIRFAQTGTVRVAPTVFSSEQIRFDQALSRLATGQDARKEEEQRRLRAELQAFRPEAVRHLGPFLPPLASMRQTSAFADRREYLYADGGSSLSHHNGVDLAAPTGTPVLACGAGRVVLAAERVLTGNSVVLEHLPGVFSLYYHLSQLAVEQGQEVQAGDRLGLVGMTGLATGPHLHWEVRVNAVPVDPQFLLARPLVDKTRYNSIMEELFLDEGR